MRKRVADGKAAVLAAEILRFAQDDNGFVGADYILRAWGAAVLRPYMNEVDGCSRACTER